ncbi:MAG: cytochrome P450, partial [Actinobacteria bacterium]|nr:cytochrome P450 [Actinomycetota bacterium]
QEQNAQWESRFKAEIDERERKIQALAGVVPQEETRADQIKEQFFGLFPQFKGLTPENIEKLMGLLDSHGTLQADNELRWQAHSQSKLTELYGLGVQAGLPDNDQVRGMLHTALIGYLSANPQEQRRFAADPGFIPEFFKAYSAAMIDPLRRTQAAAIQGRVAPALPQDTPSGAVRTATPGIKPKDLTERAALSWTAFNQSKNGGSI